MGEGGISNFTNFTTDDGLALDAIGSSCMDKFGNLWFGTYGGGVSRYDGKSFTNYTTAQGLANNTVRSITEDGAGNLWFGTNGGGVSRYDGKSFTNFTTAQGLANNDVWSITEDQAGNLWFGTYGGGVSRYDGNENPNNPNPLKRGYYSDNNLADKTEDEPEKLFDKNEKVKPDLFSNYTTQDGLPDNFVTQVIELSDGTMLIGTNYGICELSLDRQNGKYKVGRTFNSTTGHPVKDVNSGQDCMFKDSKGIVWMGTGADKTALVRFDPSALYKNPLPPTVIIQTVKLNEENICWYNLIDNGKLIIDNGPEVRSQKKAPALIAPAFRPGVMRGKSPPPPKTPLESRIPPYFLNRK